MYEVWIGLHELFTGRDKYLVLADTIIALFMLHMCSSRVGWNYEILTYDGANPEFAEKEGTTEKPSSSCTVEE